MSANEDTIDEYDQPSPQQEEVLDHLNHSFNDLMINRASFLAFCKHRKNDPLATVIQELSEILVPYDATKKPSDTLVDQRIEKIYTVMDNFKHNVPHPQSLTVFSKDEENQMYARVSNMGKLFENFLTIHPKYNITHEASLKHGHINKK